MDAEKIRKQIPIYGTTDYETLKVFFLGEIAAQLAELNETLRQAQTLGNELAARKPFHVVKDLS